jgi:hypothetical protein
MSAGCRGKPALQNRMNNAPFFSFAAQLRDFMSASRNGAKETFEQLAKQLFNLQLHRNSAYQRLCRSRKARPMDWTDIPAVPTSAFKELALTCLPPEERTAVFHSSGTTGQKPSRHFHNAESLRIYEESISAAMPPALRQFKGTTDRRPLLILTPDTHQAPHSSLVHMFEVFKREFGSATSRFVGSAAQDGTWSLDLDACLQVLKKAVTDRIPITVLGTAFSYVHLLDHLEASGLEFRLPPGSTALETGGYKGRSRAMPKQDLHLEIEKRLGIPKSHIFSEYGMSELSSQAYDSPSTGSCLFRFPPWARAIIVSPETGREVAHGETGLLRIFDLANVFSVMAIQSEDLAVRHPAGFELLGRAELAEPRGCSLMPT